MTYRKSSVSVVLASLCLAGTASAGALDHLKQSAENTMSQGAEAASSAPASGGSALLSQLATGSLNLGGAKNVAGVLGYCQKQGFTEDTENSVKSALLAKLGGQNAVAEDTAYQQGQSGVLESDQGHSFSLANMKDGVGRRVCDMIAKKAEATFLGS